MSGRVEAKAGIRVKLAALWAATMFLFIYVDHFALFAPDVLNDMLDGKMGPLTVSQGTLAAAMVLMTIPSLMIVLSTMLRAAVCRWANIIVGGIYILVVIGNIIGETWAYYLGASVVEVILLGMIVWTAVRWPRQEG